MKKLTKTVAAAALTGVCALGSVAPSYAQNFSFSFGVGERSRADRVFSRYCDRHPGDRDCRDFRRGRFNDRDYYNFYTRHRSELSPNAGFFGFTLGTIFGAAAANSRNNLNVISGHVARCEARFQSYDRRTDLYLGDDGDYHRCRL